MHNYANPYMMDHGAHMLGQAQPPPPAYISLFFMTLLFQTILFIRSFIYR